MLLARLVYQHPPQRRITLITSLLSEQINMTPFLYAIFGITAVFGLVAWYVNTHRED